MSAYDKKWARRPSRRKHIGLVGLARIHLGNAAIHWEAQAAGGAARLARLPGQRAAAARTDEQRLKPSLPPAEDSRRTFGGAVLLRISGNGHPATPGSHLVPLRHRCFRVVRPLDVHLRPQPPEDDADVGAPVGRVGDIGCCAAARLALGCAVALPFLLRGST